MANITEIAPDLFRISIFVPWADLYQQGILAEYAPCTCLTAKNIQELADLQPRTLAIMHGSSFSGDCSRALSDLDQALKQVFRRESASIETDAAPAS